MMSGDLKPYYSKNGITIYRGDCRKILPCFPPASFDLLLSDPPWGINYQTNHNGKKGWTRRRYRKVRGDDREFDPTRLLSFDRIVLWGGNHFARSLPPSSRWLVWNKKREGLSNDGSDCELAWTRGLHGCSTRAFYLLWNGAVRTGERGQFFHPTQKPIALMRWCLGLFPEAKRIVDPYMGAGSTLIAARLQGIEAVGIETDLDYCRIAVERIEATTQNAPCTRSAAA